MRYLLIASAEAVSLELATAISRGRQGRALQVGRDTMRLTLPANSVKNVQFSIEVSVIFVVLTVSGSYSVILPLFLNEHAGTFPLFND